MNNIKPIHANLISNVVYDSDYKENCPIAAVEVINYNPDRVLNHVNFQDSIYENTLSFCKIEKIYNNSSGVFPYYEYPYVSSASGVMYYLISNYASDAHRNKEVFYQYELLFDAYSNNVDAGISIYKDGEILLDKSTYIIQYSDDLLADGSGRYSETTWNTNISSIGSIKRIRILFPLAAKDSNSYYTVNYIKHLNNAKTATEELVELEDIYSVNRDYNVTSQGIELTPNSRIPLDTSLLYLIKDTSRRIFSNGVLQVKNQGYQTDKTSSWNLALNTGSFIVRDGIFNSASGVIYSLGNVYGSGYLPINSSSAKLVRSDIIKVQESPIYVDTTNYTYPLYTVDVYDKVATNFNTIPGKISIDINGITQTNIKILSIDRKKGYIKFNTELNNVDELEVTYYTNAVNSLVLSNLELNPKIPTSAKVHIVDYLDGIGIALRPYDPLDSDTEFPYIYNPNDPESTRLCTKLVEVGDTLPSGVPWSSDFFKINEVYINKLSVDMLKITDARVIRGGINTDVTFDDNDKIKEKNWYTDMGYYDGETLPFSNTIVIHIPKYKLEEEKSKWINHIQPKYDNPQEGYTQGVRSFNAYLDQTIKRYISIGSDYILVPTELDGTFSGILNLE
jgi:hypothetical protein